MNVRLCVMLALLLCCGSCGAPGDLYVPVAANQGSFAVKREPNPLDSMPRTPPAPSGPTTREIELQRRIDDLEATQKAINAELERLKREKAAQ